MKKYRILVVDDEPDILDMLQYNLDKEGYVVKTVQDSRKAAEVALKFQPHLVLLDIMMPHKDGIQVCREIKSAKEVRIPLVYFLTARGEEYSEVAAFDAGADDYIVKPVKPRALLKRLSSGLSRGIQKETDFDLIKGGDLVIDRTSYSVTLKGTVIALPRREFELLYFLVKNSNKVFNREELLDNVWGGDNLVFSRTVDVHIRKIREKIGSHFILTKKGVGYIFQPQ